jgi:hypothetical protein
MPRRMFVTRGHALNGTRLVTILLLLIASANPALAADAWNKVKSVTCLLSSDQSLLEKGAE